MVLFVRKETKLCIEVIHPVPGWREQEQGENSMVLFQFLVPPAKLEIQKQ